MRHIHRRFRRQAEKFQLFDDVICLTEEDLAKPFVEEFRSILQPDIRGFGYFVWKPQVILQSLSKSEPDDVLLYLDSGSHIVDSGRERFLEYVDIVRNSHVGILAFELDFVVNGHTHLEKEWTKGDLIDYFGVRYKDEVVGSPQLQAGAILIHNRPGVELFFDEWLEVFRRDVALVDDSPSISLNFPEFRAHRHDQSVFSILGKLRGVARRSAREQFPAGETRDWNSLAQYPIHHRRDKKDAGQKILALTRTKVRPVELFLVRVKRLILTFFRFFH